MNTIQKLIKRELESNGYMVPNDGYLKAIEDELDKVNESQDHIYDIEDWIYETSHNSPKELRKERDNWAYAIDYLLKQRRLCIEQTGVKPCMADFEGGVECDDFKELVWGDLSMSDIFNFLLDYYEKEGKVW